jgi:hypothetical protein
MKHITPNSENVKNKYLANHLANKIIYKIIQIFASLIFSGISWYLYSQSIFIKKFLGPINFFDFALIFFFIYFITERINNRWL